MTYADERSVIPYTQTIFLKKEKAPDWYRTAVFPQIILRRKGVRIKRMISSFYGKETDKPYYIREKNGDITHWTFCGGNIQGIIGKIPYLKSLCITALYLNPIFEARSTHRYDTSDYMRIDSIIGSKADFEAVVAALHQNDMRLILDGVFSHVCRNSKYFDFESKSGGLAAYQTDKSPYFDLAFI